MEEQFVEQKWLDFAKSIGDKREGANKGNDTEAYRNNGPLPYSSLTAGRLAVVGEVAGHFYFGVDPHSTTFYVEPTAANYAALRANADLVVNGRKIEIRNSAKPTAALPIQKKDPKADSIVVQVHVEMKDKRPTGKVYFLGWRYGTDYRPEKAIRGTDYRRVKYPMSDLKRVLGIDE